jgi:hypothetical protein
LPWDFDDFVRDRVYFNPTNTILALVNFNWIFAQDLEMRGEPTVYCLESFTSAHSFPQRAAPMFQGWRGYSIDDFWAIQNEQIKQYGRQQGGANNEDKATYSMSRPWQHY